MVADGASDPDLTSKSSNDDFLSAITFQSLSSVVRMCEKTQQDTYNTVNEKYLQAFSDGTNNGHYGRRNEKNSKPEY